MTAVGMLAFFALASLAMLAESANFLKSGQVFENDVKTSLDVELAASTADSARLAALEDALRKTYAALPKNAAGNLGHQAVRYVLHRLFVQRNGWFIRGLEPNNETWHDVSKPHDLNEWVPSYLQGLLEQRMGERGTNLQELVALAAALEDLIDKEAIGRLETAYEIHQFKRTSTLSRDEALEVISTYYVNFLLAGNFSADSRSDALQKTSRFATRYAGWDEAEQWLHKTLAPYLKRDNDDADKTFDFSAVSRMVEEIGEKYYNFNDVECRDLKNTLRDMEGFKAGRVRLSQFYKKALYSHWQFTERADYLRVLGALDESDPQSPQVIVSNYIMARPNCLEASNLYAICCRNECEDLMGHLEGQVGASMADPKQIAELVAALPSDTVAAPRELPASLLGRLDQVAANNGGQVPLHGRLFAQWMHHAYPRECPYPHEAGSTSPQTPDEWMAQTGEINSQASQAEMQAAVDADTCASAGGPPQPGDCGESQSPELPWSANEELLVAHPHAPSPQAPQEAKDLHASSTPPARGATLARDIAVAGGLLAFLALDYKRTLSRGSLKVKDEAVEDRIYNESRVGWRSVMAFIALAFLLHAFNLLDTALFACAVCGGVGALAVRYVVEKMLTQSLAGEQLKCCGV